MTITLGDNPLTQVKILEIQGRAPIAPIAPPPLPPKLEVNDPKKQILFDPKIIQTPQGSPQRATTAEHFGLEATPPVKQSKFPQSITSGGITESPGAEVVGDLLAGAAMGLADAFTDPKAKDYRDNPYLESYSSPLERGGYQSGLELGKSIKPWIDDRINDIKKWIKDLVKPNESKPTLPNESKPTLPINWPDVIPDSDKIPFSDYKPKKPKSDTPSEPIKPKEPWYYKDLPSSPEPGHIPGVKDPVIPDNPIPSFDLPQGGTGKHSVEIFYRGYWFGYQRDPFNPPYPFIQIGSGWTVAWSLNRVVDYMGSVASYLLLDLEFPLQYDFSKGFKLKDAKKKEWSFDVNKRYEATIYGVYYYSTYSIDFVHIKPVIPIPTPNKDPEDIYEPPIKKKDKKVDTCLFDEEKIKKLIRSLKAKIEIPLVEAVQRKVNGAEIWIPKINRTQIEVIAIDENTAASMALVYRKIAEIQIDLIKLRNTDPPIAVIPEWWQIRIGADRPQLVALYAEPSKQGKLGRTRWPITIPHYDGAIKKPQLPPYNKGQWEGILTLKDNSKLIINAASAGEADSLLKQFSRFIKPQMLVGSISKVGLRKGPKLKQCRVVPTNARYFSTGQKNTNPDWIVNLRQ